MYLVYEKNCLAYELTDCVEEQDMTLWSKKEDAIADMQARKTKYIEDKDNDFVFKEEESNEEKIVFIDEYQKSNEDRSGEFHICMMELSVDGKKAS